MSSAESDQSPRSPSRRNFIRLLGVAGGTAAAGVGSQATPFSPVQNGQAVAPLVAVGAIGAAGYLSGRAAEAGIKHFTDLGESSDYDESSASALYTQARFDHKTIKSANDSVLTTLENLVQNASQIAYQEARGAVLKALNNGKTPAKALDAGYTAIDEYILPNQKNLIDRYTTAVLQIKTAHDRAKSSSVVDRSNLWQNANGNFEFPEVTIGLADGSSHPATKLKLVGATYQPNLSDTGSNNVSVTFKGSTPYTQTDYSNIQPLMSKRFAQVLNDLDTAWQDARSEIDTFVNSIGSSYQAGEISTEDITTPSDLFSMASQDSSSPYAAADLAGLGLQVNQSNTMVVDLLDDGQQLEGSVYLNESPIGGSLSVGSVYDPSLSRPTDSDGNYTDSANDYAGTESDPIPIEGLAYIAYNTESGSTYAQIQQPFKVTSATDADGNDLQQVGYQPSKGQQTTTTDISELKDQLNSMNEELQRLDEERQEAATGGGGVDLSGLSAFGLPGELVGVIIAVVGGFLLAK